MTRSHRRAAAARVFRLSARGEPHELEALRLELVRLLRRHGGTLVEWRVAPAIPGHGSRRRRPRRAARS